MSELLVDAREIGRTYSGAFQPVVALSTATCTIRAGDRVTIVGPSGSGKSTLLHLLGGLDEPTTGTVVWPALGPRDRLRPKHVAYAFQSPSLLAPLSVVENVELPLFLGHLCVDNARASALDALARLDLADLADKLPEEISGGQAQRVAMARAMVCQPRLILADEPTGQLDHPTARHLLDVVLDALAGTTTALVIATHDSYVAERMATTWYVERGTLKGTTA